MSIGSDEFYGSDLEEAKKRADEIGGIVIESKPPESFGNPIDVLGFWVDEKDTLVRSWEKVVYRSK